MTCTVTGEDIRKGSVRNTVTASGTPSGGPPVTSLPSSAEVTTSRGHGHHDGHREPGRPHHDHEGPHKPHDPHGRPDAPHGDGHHAKRPRQAA